MRTIALESFKILNKLSPAYLNDLLTVKNHSYNFRYQKTVEVPQVRTVKHVLGPFAPRQPKSGILFLNIFVILAVLVSSKTKLMHGAGGPVHVHSVLFCWLKWSFLHVSLFSCKIVMINFLIFQQRHMLWVLRRTS